MEQKNEEISRALFPSLLVVPFPDTVADPRTVMIELLDAVIAVITMRGAWWTEQMTRSAKSDFLGMSGKWDSVHTSSFDVFLSEDSFFLEEPFLDLGDRVPCEE